MNVEVTIRGNVPAAVAQIAREKLGRLEQFVKGPLLSARVVLSQEENPRIELPARAKGEIDLQGRWIRAGAAGATMESAVDELAERMQRQLRRYVDHVVTRGHNGASSPAGEWRHGSWSEKRPDHFRRPAGEREIVRRKSFASGSMTVVEAAADLEALDHDFYVFSDVDTGFDAVVYRRDDGRLGLIEPQGARPRHDGPVWETSRYSAAMDIAVAVAEMDELDHRFLFFVDADTGRGTVIYTRYDGHYGLIEAA